MSEGAQWNTWLLLGLSVGVSLLIGLLVGWLWGASRTRRGAEAAFRLSLDDAKAQAMHSGRTDAEAALNPLLATVQERARLFQAERDGLDETLRSFRQQAEGWRSALDTASNERAQFAERAERLPQLADELAGLRVAHDASRADAGQLRTQLVELQTRIAAERHEAEQVHTLERSQAKEKIALLIEAREHLGNQFKALANDILEEKSKRFAEQNQASLGALLDPLRLRLSDFQGKVEQFYVAEGQQRSALSEQVRQLFDLNQVMTAEARNLTNALKGSTKTQGNWGELILERVLEASGLRRGIEFHVQQSEDREDGSRAQPDVVIHLPEERRLVIDAKVSLLAYEEGVRAEGEAQRSTAEQKHVASVRRHIDGLSKRRYEALYGIRSLDFVLMFMPVEPAFMWAISADEHLGSYAWERNVLLVSPSTLLFVLRTVAHLWRQEAQTRNAQEIAKRGAELYDKLAGFVADLEKVGKSLDTAQGAYRDAFGKLTGGKGNAIRQAEMLRELGVQPSKTFSPATLDSALPDDREPESLNSVGSATFASATDVQARQSQVRSADVAASTEGEARHVPAT
ncbi:MAG: DNA recombination protein RmuC [Variovorax sp.]